MRPYIWTFVGPCPGASKARMVERGRYDNSELSPEPGATKSCGRSPFLRPSDQLSAIRLDHMRYQGCGRGDRHE
jgi:hypothetical protein